MTGRVEVAGPWPVHWCRGTVEELHAGSSAQVATTDPLRRQVRILEPTDAAVVLGSAEPATHVHPAQAAARGLQVVRRRSGGGAVLLTPLDVVWVDVVVPAGDRLWLADIGRAAWWLGEVWACALGDLGIAHATVHRGRFERRRWSERVCFAGLGPGEVTVQGRKLVGLSQRRTRSGILLQCAALLTWRPEVLLDVLDLSDSQRRDAARDLADAGAGVGSEGGQELLGRFLGRLRTR